MSTAAPSPVTVSGKAPLYTRPEPLNQVDHGKLGLKHHENPFSVADEQHFLPLQINEFGSAACNMPIVFMGDERHPIAVLGLTPGQNLYKDDIPVRGETYVPAYLRRYPFTVATADQPGGAEGERRAVICIDAGSKLIGENPDLPFFVDGKYSQYTEDCVKFCQDYEQNVMLTRSIIKRMRDLDLFEHRTVEYKPKDDKGNDMEAVHVAGFWAVSQTKLNALPVETYLQLRDQGVLSAIFAHWMSQWHWDTLVARAARLENDRMLKPQGKRTKK